MNKNRFVMLLLFISTIAAPLLARIFHGSESAAWPKPMNTALSLNFDQSGMYSYSPDQNSASALSHQLFPLLPCESHEISGLASSEQAVFGGGCCWCTEAIFEQMPGVTHVQMGFAGGTKKNPTYKEICKGDTGHAEVVKVTYNPKKISYSQVLDFFWRIHDPTSLNHQGPDRGTQYRSLILTTTSEQQRLAEFSKKRAQVHFSKPIVTEIKPLTNFYPVRADHHSYYQNHPNDLYCRAYITPELKKLGLRSINRAQDNSSKGQTELEQFKSDYRNKHSM